MSGAETSSIVDILGLFVHVEGGLDISKHVYHPFTLKGNLLKPSKYTRNGL